MIRHLRFQAALLGLCFSLGITGPALQAVTTAGVSTGNEIYEVLDRLEAYGCLQPTFRLFRPLSYFDLRQSMFIPKGTDCAAPEWLIHESKLFSSLTYPANFSATAVVLENDAVSLPGIEATTIPMFPLREGRTTFSGASLILEGNLQGHAGRDVGFAFLVTPGWLIGLKEYNSFRGKAYLHEGYVKVGFRKTELTFGRMALGFGQTKHGSLLLSSAAKPFNLIKLGVRPHILGTPFQFLGDFSFETFLTMGAESAFVDGAKLWGIMLGMRPVHWLEFGFLQLYQFGGNGAPSLGIGDVMGMLVYTSSDALNQKRHRNLGFHLNIWGPSRNFKFYTQLMFSRLGAISNWFSDDLSLLIGIWFPKLGQAEARLEYVRTVPSAYQHSFWRQGLTYISTPVGHPLGPDAEAVYLDVGFPAISRWRPSLLLGYEARLKNPAAPLATEWRYLAGAEVKRRWLRMDIGLSAKYSRAIHHRFDPGQTADLFSFLGFVRYSLF